MTTDRTILGTAGLLLLFFTGVVIAGSGPKVTPYPPDWPHRAPWKLNRELLLPETRRIVFLVDVPRGLTPKWGGMDHLAELAARHGRREASWVLLEDEKAPNIEWVISDPEKTVYNWIHLGENRSLEDPGFHGDWEDIILIYRQVPSCPDGPLDPETGYVFVRYVGMSRSAYGGVEWQEPTPDCGRDTVPVIYIYQDAVATARAPGISREFLEKRDLAHEYGHVLGLPSNPDHGWWRNTLDFSGNIDHCTNRECAVAVPTAKALLRGQMLDYCEACKRDIEQAREHWLTGKEFPESPRLPQTDPVEVVNHLKKRNFTRDGLAWRLILIGKPIMPALMERAGALPGDKESSPKAVATEILIRIILDEDRKRRGPGTGREYQVSRKNRYERLQDWWGNQGAAFMAGDDWELPDFILAIAG